MDRPRHVFGSELLPCLLRGENAIGTVAVSDWGAQCARAAAKPHTAATHLAFLLGVRERGVMLTGLCARAAHVRPSVLG